jgi:ribosomal protein L10
MASKNFFKLQLTNEFESKDLTLFIQYSDYTVKEWDLLKSQLIHSGFKIKRIKNSGFVKKLENGSLHKLRASFHGSMAIISCSQQFSPELLKEITNIIEKQSKMKIICALLHNNIVFPGTLKKWSKLPQTDELYFSLVGLLNRPIQKFIHLSTQGINNICSDLNKYTKLGDQ